jgi:ABC-type branched-subunit amino acid transport system ATPase component
MLLEIDGLTKRFGGLTAVSAVSFGIREGEIVGVFGPNGSGKTTLLSLIAGSIVPTSGTVRWDGHALPRMKAHDLAAMGIVKTFQNPQLFAELTVVQHLQISGHLMLKRRLGWRRLATLLGAHGRGSVSEMETRLEHVLRICRLALSRDQPAAALSYGEEKMLGVAMAMMCEPKLLLLDEPASGLGQAEIENLEAVLRDLRKHGTTLCIIDHKVRFLGRLADRAISLHHGTKIAEGTPNEVLTHADVVAAYLGTRRA